MTCYKNKLCELLLAEHNTLYVNFSHIQEHSTAMASALELQYYRSGFYFTNLTALNIFFNPVRLLQKLSLRAFIGAMLFFLKVAAFYISSITTGCL